MSGNAESRAVPQRKRPTVRGHGAGPKARKPPVELYRCLPTSTTSTTFPSPPSLSAVAIAFSLVAALAASAARLSRSCRSLPSSLTSRFARLPCFISPVTRAGQVPSTTTRPPNPAVLNDSGTRTSSEQGSICISSRAATGFPARSIISVVVSFSPPLQRNSFLTSSSSLFYASAPVALRLDSIARSSG
jgi:hypothetical protein